MRRPFILTIILSIVAMLAASSALSAQAAGAWPRAVRDDMGTALAIAKKPERIVSVTLPTDEILFALVEKRRLAAVTGFSQDSAVSNIAAQVSDVPVKLSQLNVEVIVSLKPDIVFVADWSDASSVRQLRDAGLAVYQFKSPLTVKEIQAGIARIAVAVGEEAKGKALVQWMDGRLVAVASRLAGLPPGKRLTVMDYNTWSSSMGRGSSWDEIVRLAGLENAVAGLSADQYGSVPISREKLLERDPDILILPGWVYGDPAGADSFYLLIVNDPALRHMKAVREARVHRIAERTKSSTSQYIVLAVEELAKYAYPELFR
jgi:iron complex transport system substrate-binding protein